MGVLDGSSSEEDDTPSGPVHSTTEDEDPLEAYMKNLDQLESSRNKGERMDLQEDLVVNEPQERPLDDEATLRSVVYDETPFLKVFRSGKDTFVGREWRRKHQISCNPPIDPVLNWRELENLYPSKHLNLIREFESPTLVQSQTLPVVWSGKNALITAQTGQGKTLSYLWPMLLHLRDSRARGLVLCPTRELALQVSKVAKPYTTSEAVVGGTGNTYQLSLELQKTSLVIATPGRLLDMLKKKFSLEYITIVVLDEADKLLSMGFEEQVTDVLERIRPDRQILMLSATMGRRIENVAREWLGTFTRISVGRTGQASKNVEQNVVVLKEDEKEKFLLSLLPSLTGKCLVFCATKDQCEVLASKVRQQCGLNVDTLHGDKHQLDRIASLKSFTKGSISFLICTDLAARGLDIPLVETVINFDPAKNLDSHVHRVGRAGRLGQQVGTAYTLLTEERDVSFARVLRNAFEREGIPVSNELNDLVSKHERTLDRAQPSYQSLSKRGRYN